MQQNARIKTLVRELVASKQLEFVNGGLCMNDEATTHYADIIDQVRRPRSRHEMLNAISVEFFFLIVEVFSPPRWRGVTIFCSASSAPTQFQPSAGTTSSLYLCSSFPLEFFPEW